MGLRGNAVLVNWGGIVNSKDSDYNAWHSLEHMPERVALSGFLRGFRGIGIDGTDESNKYFMMYEAEDKAFFESKEYLDRLNNPTEWTKKILSCYIKPSRTICDVFASKSVGLGGFFGTLRFLDIDFENELDIHLLKKKIHTITYLSGITGMHLLLGDVKFGQIKTQEKKFRSNQGYEDEVISFAIILEGLSFSSLKNAIKKLKIDFNLNEDDLLKINYYKCQHVITKTDLINI